MKVCGKDKTIVSKIEDEGNNENDENTYDSDNIDENNLEVKFVDSNRIYIVDSMGNIKE